MPKINLVHYVEFLYPSFDIPNSPKKIRSRKSKFKVPNEAIGYRFFDRPEVKTKQGEILSGKRRNYSPITYFGETMSLYDIKGKTLDKRMIISNEEDNNYHKVVRTKDDQYFELDPDDMVIKK